MLLVLVLALPVRFLLLYAHLFAQRTYLLLFSFLELGWSLGDIKKLVFLVMRWQATQLYGRDVTGLKSITSEFSISYIFLMKMKRGGVGWAYWILHHRFFCLEVWFFKWYVYHYWVFIASVYCHWNDLREKKRILNFFQWAEDFVY